MFKRILSLVFSVAICLNIFAFNIVNVTAVNDYEKKAKELEKTSYKGELGAIYSKKSTEFRVWSPKAKSIKVRLYKYGSDDEGSIGYLSEKPMKLNKENGVWSVVINGDLKNQYYTYYIQHGSKSYETSDIYAKACGVNGNRSMIVDLDSTDPNGWEEDTFSRVNNSTEAMIWEVQIADFSHSESSGISKENRGKFLAFTESGTTVDSVKGAPSTCVDYLKELGVNYVHINPFYDFGSINEADKSNKDSNYNWGYDPVNYNCPEGSYSSNPYDGNVRIEECKKMIMALHKAGIGVIMDVVYNHTQKGKDSNFNLTVPDYYYRIDSNGKWSNGSACGNDTASERVMYSKYMVDSVLYWAKEYHLDGFRFDLMGLHDVETMNNIRKELDKLENGEKILMYGEPWQLSTVCDSDCELSNQSNVYLLDDRIAAFDDTFRDSLKGSTSGVDKGFIQSGDRAQSLKQGIEGQSSSTLGWANKPTQCVNYGSCHDNLTMWDKLVKSVLGNDADFYSRNDDLVAMNKLAGAVTYSSQGISFILAGEEFCRSKNGDENSYNSGFKINEINWDNLYTYGDVVDYYKGLIEIRKNISAFTDPTTETVNSIEYLENLPTGVLGYKVKDEKYSEVCVIFNGSDEEAVVNIDGEWTQIADENSAGIESIKTIENEIKIKKKSAAILVNKNAFDSIGNEKESGKVFVRYFSGDKAFKTYVLNGKIGDKFKIEQLQSLAMDYNVKKIVGNKGTFESKIQYCDFYCEKFEGNVTSVTFKFLDSKTDKSVANSIVMTSRQGEKYESVPVPSVKGYNLNIDKLPENSCGVFDSKDIEVKYYYDKINVKSSECLVNIIYLSTDGDILSFDEKLGHKNSNYHTQQIEIPEYKFYKVIGEANGLFTKNSQTVIYLYSPVTITTMMMYIILAISAVIIVGLFVAVHYYKKKKYLIKNLDIG